MTRIDLSGMISRIVDESLDAALGMTERVTDEALDGTLGAIGRFERGERESDEVQLEVPAEPGQRVVIRSHAGRVSVRAGEPGAVHVSAIKRGPSRHRLDSIEITAGVRDGAIVVEFTEPSHRGLGGRNVSVAFDVVVPPGTPLEASTGAGSIEVSDVGPAVKLTSGAGKITVSGSRGPFVLTSGAGGVRGESLAGGGLECSTGGGTIRIDGDFDDAVALKAGAGRIDFHGRAPSIAVRTGGGSIDVSTAEGSVTAEAGAGNVTVTGRLRGASSLRAGMGRVEVRLSPSCNLKVAARGVSASNDLGLPILNGNMVGVIGDGSEGTLKIQAGGKVELRRA